MKRKYVTPVIEVEHYELTQAVASCETKVGFADQNCARVDPDVPGSIKDFIEFGYWSDKCEVSPEGMDDFDGVCYHTSAGALFVS